MSSDGSLEDFRRYDIVEGRALKLLAHCDAHYSTVDHGFHTVDCDAPSGDGLITVRGEILRWRAPRRYDLTVAAERVPVQSLLSVVRRAKKNLPDDLLATGNLEAHFHLRSGETGPVLVDGGGETTGFRLQSAATKSEVVLDTVPFSLRTRTPAKILKRSFGQQISASLKQPDEPHLAFGPVSLKLGRPTPATVAAWITRSGYNIWVEGDTDVPRLLDVARITGVPAIHPVFTGSAKVNLQVAGNWSGFATPIATGTAQLHAVRAEVRGLNTPLEIAAATVNLGSEEARVEAISASIAGAEWTGSLSLPRTCNSIQSCPIRFDLHADEIVTEKLGELLNSNPPKRPWYRFLSTTPQAGKPFLLRAHASGKLAANRLVIRNLVSTRLTAQVELEEGKLRLSDVRGEVMGGKHRGDWWASFTAKPVTYSGSGTLENVSVGQVADAMHDDWIRGTANGKYTIDMAGFSSAELAASAHGTLQFTLRDGALPHIALAASPLRVRRFTGSLDFRGPQVEMRDATLDVPGASFVVNGTAFKSKKLDFKLVQEGVSAFNVTGTLSDPQVAPANRAETRAALKP